ncbi:MAG TPA: hypothetical protein VJO35_01525 [Terriglobales bacterium]|nr:hypothetical protein [Terriglobales bacterium]
MATHQLNAARFVLTSGSVSNAYYPPSECGFGLSMSRSAISARYGTLGGVANEFYPDIRQRRSTGTTKVWRNRDVKSDAQSR